MIQIRYSARSKKISEMADISGTWKAFETLRQDILQFLESNNQNIFFDVDKNIDSVGWDIVLENLEIIQNGNVVKISVLENKTLRIKGSKENLKIFADWFEFDENTPSGYHSHYEYFEGNEYIDSESIPLVIRIK